MDYLMTQKQMDKITQASTQISRLLDIIQSSIDIEVIQQSLLIKEVVRQLEPIPVGETEDF